MGVARRSGVKGARGLKQIREVQGWRNKEGPGRKGWHPTSHTQRRREVVGLGARLWRPPSELRTSCGGGPPPPETGIGRG